MSRSGLTQLIASKNTLNVSLTSKRFGGSQFGKTSMHSGDIDITTKYLL